MDVQTLRTFVAVAEELHFGRAAERLRMAQQAVSQHVKRLERDIGAELFRRTTRRVELTQAGAALQAEAGQILEYIDDTRRRVGLLAVGEAGTCRLAYDPSTVTTVLPRAIRACDRDLPGVDIHIEELCSDDIGRRLLAGGVDVGIVGPAADLDGLDRVVLAVDRPVLVVPETHELSARGRQSGDTAPSTNLPPKPRTVALADLEDQPFISYDPDATGDACRLMDRLLSTAEIDPAIAHTATSELAVLGLVAAGCGIGIVSRHAADTTALPVHVLDIEPTLTLHSWLVWVPGRIDGPAEKVVATISATQSSAAATW